VTGRVAIRSAIPRDRAPLEALPGRSWLATWPRHRPFDGRPRRSASRGDDLATPEVEPGVERRGTGSRLLAHAELGVPALTYGECGAD